MLGEKTVITKKIVIELWKNNEKELKNRIIYLKISIILIQSSKRTTQKILILFIFKHIIIIKVCKLNSNPKQNEKLDRIACPVTEKILK